MIKILQTLTCVEASFDNLIMIGGAMDEELDLSVGYVDTPINLTG